MKNKILKKYVSEIDNFLQDFDKQKKLSESQRKEIEKYQRVYFLRDNENREDTQQTLWEGF